MENKKLECFKLIMIASKSKQAIFLLWILQLFVRPIAAAGRSDYTADDNQTIGHSLALCGIDNNNPIGATDNEEFKRSVTEQIDLLYQNIEEQIANNLNPETGYINSADYKNADLNSLLNYLELNVNEDFCFTNADATQRRQRILTEGHFNLQSNMSKKSRNIFTLADFFNKPLDKSIFNNYLAAYGIQSPITDFIIPLNKYVPLYTASTEIVAKLQEPSFFEKITSNYLDLNFFSFVKNVTHLSQEETSLLQEDPLSVLETIFKEIKYNLDIDSKNMLFYKPPANSEIDSIEQNFYSLWSQISSHVQVSEIPTDNITQINNAISTALDDFESATHYSIPDFIYFYKSISDIIDTKSNEINQIDQSSNKTDTAIQIVLDIIANFKTKLNNESTLAEVKESLPAMIKDTLDFIDKFFSQIQTKNNSRASISLKKTSFPNLLNLVKQINQTNIDLLKNSVTIFDLEVDDIFFQYIKSNSTFQLLSDEIVVITDFENLYYYIDHIQADYKTDVLSFLKNNYFEDEHDITK
ncbi:MAG: hypothetical protein MHPSP_001051 [Paramarteilia canceri]